MMLSSKRSSPDLGKKRASREFLGYSSVSDTVSCQTLLSRHLADGTATWGLGSAVPLLPRRLPPRQVVGAGGDSSGLRRHVGWRSASSPL
jgi:hypothetical protein